MDPCLPSPDTMACCDSLQAIRGSRHVHANTTKPSPVRRASSLTIGASLGSASGTQRSQIGAGVGGTSPGLGLVEGVEVDAHEWAKSLRATLQREVDGEWDCDVFELTQVTLGRPLLHAGMHVFRRNGLLGELLGKVLAAAPHRSLKPIPCHLLWG